MNARDFEALERLPFHPDSEFHSAVAASEGAVYRGGVQGLRRWARDIDATWDEFHIEIEDLCDVADDRNVALLRITATARQSGIPLDMRISQLWTWAGGLFLRNESFTDPRGAFRAAGLEP